MLAVDLAFQNYDQELATLPGKYAPPYGRLLLAYYSGQLAACVALRPFNENQAEIKRLFVRPLFRRMGIARALLEKIVQEAAAIGYSQVILDTQTTLSGSVELYKKNGVL